MRLFSRLLTVAALAPVALIFAAGPAAAHTGFESSDPADGAQFDDPVGTVTLVFTGEAEPTGDGFEALVSDGTVRVPSEATTDDGTTWTLRFDPPLDGGSVGFRWTVRAPDSHPIDGSFVFAAGAAASGGAAGQLEEFLATSSDATGASRAASAGRMVSLTGALLALGALAFMVTVLRGRPRDIHQVMFWVRRSGLLITVGAAVELVAQVGIESSGDWSALTSPTMVFNSLTGTAGVAVLLRLCGGMALTLGTRPVTLASADLVDPVLRVRELVGAGPLGRSVGDVDGEGPEGGSGDPYAVPDDVGWAPDRASMGALIGAGAVVSSFAFDGHTVSKGMWLSTALLDVIHVAAAAVWVGGVAMLAVVAWHRHRRSEPVRAAHLAVRFSVVATGALVAVAVAGLAMTIVILDSPGELLSTPWGRLLLIKSALVAVAGGAGAYNHTLLIPELEQNRDDPELEHHFRRVVTVEAGLLVAVGLVTAWLVGAAS